MFFLIISISSSLSVFIVVLSLGTITSPFKMKLSLGVQRGAQGHIRSCARNLIAGWKRPRSIRRRGWKELSAVLTGPRTSPLLTQENEAQDPGQATQPE